jgi:hypothetical protein
MKLKTSTKNLSQITQLIKETLTLIKIIKSKLMLSKIKIIISTLIKINNLRKMKIFIFKSKLILQDLLLREITKTKIIKINFKILVEKVKIIEIKI